MARIRRHTSMPLMPGRSTSKSTMSGGFSVNRARPSVPSGGQLDAVPLDLEAGRHGLAVGLLVLDDQHADLVIVQLCSRAGHDGDIDLPHGA